MRILVTGSEGSLMQALIPKLLSQDHTIIGVDNLHKYGSCSAKANVDYEFYKYDLLNADQVLKIVKKVDVVIHAAAKIYGVLGLRNYRADILGDEVTVARNILNACVQNNISHIVYMSSSMVYDACPQDVNIPLVESMPFEYPYPNTDYGLGKLVTERLCKAYRQQYGINYTIWRPFNIVDTKETSSNEQGISHVIPDFINSIVNKKLNPLPIIGNGEQIRCFTLLDDVVDIMSKYTFSKDTTNEIINIGSSDPISMKELANLINAQSFGTDRILNFVTANNYEHDVLVRVPSIEKLKNIAGEIKFTPIEKIVQKCLAENK